MSRVSHENPGGENPNPAEKFLIWKSNDKNFSFWNKDLGDDGENEAVPLPLKFVFIQHYHTVRGWDDASESKIYANEVFFIGSQELTVRSYKGGQLGEGLYKDIKPNVMAKGGVYYRSIYVMLEDGTLVNIGLKGSAVKEYSDFVDKNKNALDNNWITVTGAEPHKKGSIKYTTPIFEVGAKLNKKADGLANDAAALVQLYFDGKYVIPEAEETVEDQDHEGVGEDKDDLDF